MGERGGEQIRPEEVQVPPREVILISNYDRADDLSRLLAGYDIATARIPDVGVGGKWARDLFTQLGNLIITRSGDRGSIAKILDGLSLEERFEIIESELGEGGMVRVSGTDILVHEKLVNDPLIPKIREMGFNVVFVPMPSHFEYQSLPEGTDPKRKKLCESVIANEHIDRQIGLVILPDSKKLLVVNPAYYQFYKENLFYPEKGLDEIAKRNGWEVFVLTEEDEENMAVNFKQTADTRLLMPSPCGATAERLAERLGKPVLVVPKEMVVDEKETGAFNCRINELHY